MTGRPVIIVLMTDRPQQAGTRSRRKEARPTEIVSAALTLFVARGLGATKLEDVAKAAGIAKGTIYLYFPTKEDLFRAVVRQELLPALERIEIAAAAHTGSSADILRLLAGRFVEIMESDIGGIPKLVVSEAGNFPEIARFYADEVVARGLRLFDGVLRRGIARGEIRPVETAEVVPIFIGPVLLMLLWRHSVGRHVAPRFDPRAVIATHLDILLRGLAPDAAP
jgi:AcrR family transcriptional regulator